MAPACVFGTFVFELLILDILWKRDNMIVGEEAKVLKSLVHCLVPCLDHDCIY